MESAPDSPAQPDHPDPPLFPGSILGLRAWKVVASGPAGELRLAAAYVESVWAPGGWTHARCDAVGGPGDHEAPEASCSCGLYAYHPRAESASELYFEHAPDGFGTWGDRAAALPTVYGVVEAAGRVEVHAHGFRAERSRPLALVCTAEWPPERRRRLARLAAAYGAEVLEVGDAEDIVRWCERRGGVLEPETVAELLAEPADPPSPDPWTPPPSAWDRLASIASRAGEVLLLGLLGLFSIAWYGGLVALGVFFAGALLFGWADEEPERRPAQIAKAWVERDDCAVRIVVRARREVPRLMVRAGGRDAEGEGLGHFQRDVGPLEQGRSEITLARAPRALCRAGEEFTLRVRIVWPDGLGPVSELASLPSGKRKGSDP